MPGSWPGRESRCRCRPDDILIRGDLAFVRGTILLTQDAAGSRETIRTELRYLEICERVQDGTWRVIWGMDDPPGPILHALANLQVAQFGPDRFATAGGILGQQNGPANEGEVAADQDVVRPAPAPGFPAGP